MKLLSDILRDTIIDTARLMPFLFLAYLVMEYLEHKVGPKTMMALQNAGKKGPIIGSLLGAVPQCGFSAAAGLYSGNVLTLGTLLAVFLSTSDEMLPILLSERAGMSMIFTILGAKVVVGIVARVLSSGCMFAGLLACAGTGILVLFRVNKNLKKNLTIVGMLYSISVIGGVLVEIIL